MYTRTQSGGRPSEKTPAASQNFFGGNERLARGGMPLLIPKDYHGEFLREHQSSPRTEPVISEEAETWSEDTEAVSSAAKSIPSEEDLVPTSAPVQEESGSLLEGVYRLLIGETGAEEETLLLLAIALLLLWGHLDRGGLFDRSTWDSDDIALLLIGYLLIS